MNRYGDNSTPGRRQDVKRAVAIGAGAGAATAGAGAALRTAGARKINALKEVPTWQGAANNAARLASNNETDFKVLRSAVKNAADRPDVKRYRDSQRRVRAAEQAQKAGTGDGRAVGLARGSRTQAGKRAADSLGDIARTSRTAATYQRSAVNNRAAQRQATDRIKALHAGAKVGEGMKTAGRRALIAAPVAAVAGAGLGYRALRDLKGPKQTEARPSAPFREKQDKPQDGLRADERKSFGSADRWSPEHTREMDRLRAENKRRTGIRTGLWSTEKEQEHRAQWGGK